MPHAADPGPLVSVPLTEEEHAQVALALRDAGLTIAESPPYHGLDGSTLFVLVLPERQMAAAIDATRKRGETLPAGPERRPLRSSYEKMVATLMAVRNTTRSHRTGGAPA